MHKPCHATDEEEEVELNLNVYWESDPSSHRSTMGGHGPPYTIPHYTTFSTKGIPQLQELENALAKKGLCDPWIRNEAWRYHPGFGTRWQRARKAFFRGLPLGLGLAVITVGLEKAFGGSGHGHGHEGH